MLPGARPGHPEAQNAPEPAREAQNGVDSRSGILQTPKELVESPFPLRNQTWKETFCSWTRKPNSYPSLSLLRVRLAKQYTMTDLDDDTGGPARYVRVSETGGKLGFITPMTHNFCESCNRVRITCTGTLHTCLGHEDASDLRKPLRASAEDDLLSAAIDRAIGLKPKGHDFIIDRRHNRPSVSRHMSVTGG